jgi:GAF domain-containing protein
MIDLAALADARRLRVLAGIDLQNPRLRARLDEVATRTAQRLGMPISLASIVLDTAQYVAGSHGLTGWIAEVGGTPVEWSFCAHAVASGRPYVVPDAAADPDQAGNPLVTVDGLRSYAGVPIVVDGAVLGAHCAVGAEPHAFTEADLEILRRAADEIADLLQEYRRPA